MNSVKTLLGWLAIVGPLHMIEQLIFGIDEIYELKRLLAPFYARFQNPDYGTVVLVTIGGASIFALFYMLEAQGRARRAAVMILALLCVGEFHHVVKAIVRSQYNPGLAMAVPFVAIGVLLFRALRSEYHDQQGQLKAVA
jgi:hypothetical protein